MARGRHDKHDVSAGRNPAKAMHQRRAIERPARPRFIENAAHLCLGHAGIMFEFQGSERSLLVATQAREGDHCADIRPADRQPELFGGSVEIFGLNADGEHHPPVIGGKKAISRAPTIAASCFTCALSMAVRINGPFSNA